MIVEPTTRIFIDTKFYQYFDAIVSESFKGFATDNVCECVCGFITSKQGFAFFHFHRSNDPSDLAKKIKHDFKHATNVKITLIGGNINFVFLPWKEKKREVAFKNNEVECYGKEAFKQIGKTLLESPKNMRTACRCPSDWELNELRNLEESVTLKIQNKNLLLYDYNALDKYFKENELTTQGFNKNCTFKICGVKDLIGYQNLAKVINALTEDTGLFSKKNIKHYNCESGNYVTADFNGEISSRAWDNFEQLKHVEISAERIANVTKPFKNRSIKANVTIGF